MEDVTELYYLVVKKNPDTLDNQICCVNETKRHQLTAAHLFLNQLLVALEWVLIGERINELHIQDQEGPEGVSWPLLVSLQRPSRTRGWESKSLTGQVQDECSTWGSASTNILALVFCMFAKVVVGGNTSCEVWRLQNTYNLIGAPGLNLLYCSIPECFDFYCCCLFF